MTWPAAPALHAVKGHGTKNDFVLLDGRDGGIELTDELVRALADRRGGIGGDGVIRLVASDRIPDGAASLAENPAATWFMDYRNADGSLAQMCGNGVRVFATWLERLGLWDPATGELVVGTRAGAKRVRREDGPDGDPWYAVDMGPWFLPGGPVSQSPVCPTGGAGVGIPKKISKENQLAAAKFIGFLTNPENTIKMTKATGYMPVRKSADTSALLAENPLAGEAIKQLDVTRTQDRARAFLPGADQEMAKSVAKIVTAEADVKATMTDLKATLEKIFDTQVKQYI